MDYKHTYLGASDNHWMDRARLPSKEALSLCT